MSSNNDLKFYWVSSILDIDPEDWDRCFKKQRFARTRKYQESVEVSAPEGVIFQYLMVFRAELVIAIVGCFRYHLPLAVIATGKAREIADYIDSFKPGLLSVNTFFAGQYTAVCDHLFGLDDLHDSEWGSILTQCIKAIDQRSLELGCSLTAIKEVPASELEKFQTVLGSDWLFANSLPNTFLTLDPNKPYVSRMRSKYRNLYRKRTRDFDSQGYTWKVVDGAISTDTAKEIHRLYKLVMNRSDNQFERLPQNFFEEICRQFESAFAILCYDDDRLIAASINADDGDTVYGIYLGFEGKDHETHIYFNLLYKLIDVAEQRGRRRIHFGQTSYGVKSAIGVSAHKMFLGLYFRNFFIRSLARRFIDTLFPETNFPTRNVFSKNSTKGS